MCRLVLLLLLGLIPISRVHAFARLYASEESSRDPLASSYYVKLGPAGTAGGARMPSAVIGVGGRHPTGTGGAIDLSLQFTGLKTFAFPRIQYLQMVTPCLPSSLYYGGGLSFGQLRNRQGKFLGLMGECTVGYNFFKNGRLCSFIEAGLTQPIMPVTHSTTFAPAFAVAIGVGY